MNHSTKALSRRGALAGLTAMLVVSVLMSGAARAVTPEEIKVKGGDPVRFSVRLTRHGPLVSDAINDINAARPVYRLFGQPDNIGYFNHHTGHTPSPDSVVAAFDWLDYFLKP